MNNALISIIIPVYNVEKYIRKCLDSVKNQTYTNWECILVDDGSTDSSPSICDEYASTDPRINIIHKKNEGVSIARNIGIEKSSGKYIIFVDSDDWIDLFFLETIIKEHNDSDILYYGNKRYFHNNNIVAYFPHPVTCTQRDEIEKEILHLKYNKERFEYYGYTWNKVFKSSIIKDNKIQFVPHLGLREDELFTTEYIRYVRSLSVISKPIYNYRVLNIGLTSMNLNYDWINIYRHFLFKQIEYWSTDELKKYELLRYGKYLNSEAIMDKSLFSCIKKTIKAYSIVKDNYEAQYRNILGVAGKVPLPIGIAANLYKNIRKNRK